jgi:hypothetical protein
LGRDQKVHLRGILSSGRSPQVRKIIIKIKILAVPTSFNVPYQHALVIIVQLPVGPVFGPFRMVRITVFIHLTPLVKISVVKVS